MSIHSEITRIETAKSDIASAIGAKGVTVPTGTKLDGMASLIRNIEAGSGGGCGGTIVTGEISISEGEKSNGTTIATVSGLGFKPKNVFIVSKAESGIMVVTKYYILCGLSLIDGIHQNVFAKKDSSNVRVYCLSTRVGIIINDDGFSLESTSNSAYTTSKYDYLATSE